MSTVSVAITQMTCDWDLDGNLDRAETLVRDAASQGAQLVLLQELFHTPYFCAEQKGEHFDLALQAEGHPVIARFAALAKELSVVLPISFFERDNNTFYNSIAIADADGSVLGVYRKTHIPNGPGYQEKTYFAPGDTGFRVWDTAVGRLGVGICWDQWFPECARAMALEGAEILMYPTAIGNEPQDPTIHSLAHWQRVMQGHAGANLVPLMASNRVGSEPWDGVEMSFYGGSFIADAEGAKVVEMGDKPGIALAQLDLDTFRKQRREWGVFRDRRPELYGGLV